MLLTRVTCKHGHVTYQLGRPFVVRDAIGCCMPEDVSSMADIFVDELVSGGSVGRAYCSIRC